MLDAAITERVRVLVRGVNSKNIYSLKGKHAENTMLQHLREKLQDKAVNVKSVIITNVVLPEDVAKSMEEKTIYQFKNTLEIKKQAFELRTLNDNEEIEIIKQKRKLERE